MKSKSTEQQLEELKRENEKLRKQNKEYREVIEISKELLKEYRNKQDKEINHKVIDKKKWAISTTKILKYLGIPKSSYYYKNKIKEVTDRQKTIKGMIEYIFKQCPLFDVLGRQKLIILINILTDIIGIKEVTEWELRKVKELFDIKANLVTKNHHIGDPKNTDCAYSNLIQRNGKADKPGQKLFTDVTYLSTPTGNLYISAIIDSFDFSVVGGAASEHNDTQLILSSLKKIKRSIDGAIIHSDHGTVYSSGEYINYCQKHNLRISMSRIANSLDNYPIEHHFSNLKREVLGKIPLKQRSLKYITLVLDKFYYPFYNNLRISTYNSTEVIKNIYNLFVESSPSFSS